jgi:hypothetical protein
MKMGPAWRELTRQLNNLIATLVSFIATEAAREQLSRAVLDAAGANLGACSVGSGTYVAQGEGIICWLIV